MSCNLSFILIVQLYAKQLNHIYYSEDSSWHMLGLDNSKFSRLISDWSVENMIPDMTPYEMLLDDSVSPKKKIKTIRQTSNFRLNIICIIVRNLLLIKVLSFSSGIYLPLLWEKSFCWKMYRRHECRRLAALLL